MREPFDLDPVAARHDLVAPMARAGLSEPQAAADLQADPFGPLLRAAALSTLTSASSPESAPSARARLLRRVARSAASSRVHHTQRHADTRAIQAAPGVTTRCLYRADARQAHRPGEPETVTLVELAPGATWSGPAADLQREWLVLRGQVEFGSTALLEHDYHVVPAGIEAGALLARRGALLYQRQSPREAAAAQQVSTQRAAGAEWADFGPGIKRRVLWQQAAQAAMRYLALPGAAVPHHGHRHDEECLMLGGDLFLDEVLLRTLDYQIAPAGTEHASVLTDTGVLLFAHGDLELDLKAA